MIDAGNFSAKLRSRMTIKTRNRLIVLFIVAFPILVLIGFVLSEYIYPPK